MAFAKGFSKNKLHMNYALSEVSILYCLDF